MEEAKNKKRSTILYLVVLMSVFVMFLATAYEYYVKVIKVEEKNVIVKNFDMLLMFDRGNQIDAHNIKKGYEETMEFSLENFSEDTIGKYKIVIEVITPMSNMINENFVYTLEGESDSKDTSNKVINIGQTPVPVLNKELGGAMITPKTVHKYKLTIKLLDDKNVNVKDNMFSIKISIANDN